jgi:hypothetical protein
MTIPPFQPEKYLAESEEIFLKRRLTFFGAQGAQVTLS